MKSLRRLLPFVGGLLLIWLLLRQIHPRDVLDLLAGIAPLSLLLGVFWYCLTNVLRAYRSGRLLGFDGPFGPLQIVPEMFAVSFLNNVLPSRAGELSFPYFLYTRHGRAVSESTTVLVVTRIFDYIGMACLFVLFTLRELPALDARAARVVSAAAALLLASILLLALTPWAASLALGLLRWLLAVFGQRDGAFDRLLDESGGRVVATFARMRNLRTYTATLLWSLLIWLTTFAWFTAYLAALGLPQRYPLVVVGSTFASLAKALPFFTIGGFGAHEAGWTLGFSLTGMETALAISSGFAVNILTLLTSLVFGGGALLLMSWRRGRERGHTSDTSPALGLLEE